MSPEELQRYWELDYVWYGSHLFQYFLVLVSEQDTPVQSGHQSHPSGFIDLIVWLEGDSRLGVRSLTSPIYRVKTWSSNFSPLLIETKFSCRLYLNFDHPETADWMEPWILIRSIDG